LCFERQEASALASSWARVGGVALAGGGGVRLPAPEKVALAGAPKISGWGVGEALHEASLSHGGGGGDGEPMHGEALVHSCAS
jgi:multidrug efflux pump subunit AcrA (membrane-fusion protein)